IGCAISDVGLYVTDERMEVQPVGVGGEIYVGGEGIARGYVGRPELTAERFLPDPFGGKPGARLYKTGDRARRLPDGDIEYLGRVDHQVKIRGFRIELGEIESMLMRHPAVREAVAVARADASGNKRLAAYVVFEANRAANVSELRRFLKEKLPDYMMPAAIIPIESLPLNANAKLDRQALPSPDQVLLEVDAEAAFPRNALEEKLAGIFAQAVGLERVGLDDNFFDLGGDSIRSIQVRAQALKQGFNLSIQQLFERPTVRSLARALVSAEPDLSPLPKTSEFGLVSEDDRARLPDDAEDAYPLTMLQAGMLFHSAYDRDAATYHDIFSFHLRARLDTSAFQTTLRKLAARHPVLRSSFDLNKFSEPLQIVHRAADVPFEVEDIARMPEDEQDATLDGWMESEKNSRLDWTRAPLIRFYVHRRGEQSFQFSVSFHHAILDGWSLASMLTELFQKYFLLLDGAAAADEPPLRSSFRDFVAMERAALRSDEARRYWNQKLADMTFTALPRWPARHGAGNSPPVRALDVSIPHEVFKGLKLLARQAAAPIKSLLLAAHLKVLALLSGQADVVTGVVSNGRPEDDEGDRALGLFLNTLPFRLKLGGGRWIDLVRQTFEAEREILPHRRFPMAELQQSLGGQPLFEAAFNFTHFHVYEKLEAISDVHLLGMKTFEQTNFVLLADFSLDVSSSEIYLSLEYNSAELTDEQVKAIGEYYLNALRAMTEWPSSRYETNSLLSASERRRLLFEWNDTAKEYPRDRCVHQSFERQAALTPGRAAVIFGRAQLTYEELNRRANMLAGHLRNLGVGPQSVVGISMGRSPEAMVALLGAMKAGAACVPLDPEYPKDRLAFIMKDARPSVLITEQRLAGRVPASGAKVLRLDADWDLVARGGGDSLTCETRGGDLAYIIYTSGSTGEPKGAQLTHRALTNLIEWQMESSKHGAGMKTLQFASLSFDVSFQEIFSTWCSGGTLVLVSEEVRRDGEALLSYVAEEGIERMFLPSVALQQMADAANRQGLAPASLSEIITAGEQLRITSTIAELFGKLKDCSLNNQYGPSETHVVTSHGLRGSPDDWPALPPIGQPISNVKIYLLDANLLPAPVGVAGELYIGGDAPGRGYHNRPDLTAEKFVPDPFAENPGARLYKTGDIARRLPDGDIEFLARNDYQVKIRGYRVEPGEVEAALGRHAAVREAVVVATGEAASKRLAAYVVAGRGMRTDASELRGFLKESLPDYMVPAVFVMLDELPLTPSGKIDRRALPAPDAASRDVEVDYVAPRTATKEKLAAIWAEVLKLKQVGIHDNFFERGGHSLLATQVMSRVCEAFGVELPLLRLFDSPTVEGLAEIIEQNMVETHKPTDEPAPVEAREPVGEAATRRAELLAERQALLEKLAALDVLLEGEGVAGPGAGRPDTAPAPDSIVTPLQPGAAAAHSGSQIAPRQEGRAAPLSFAQRRLWFIHQLDPGSPAYNISSALRLTGRLDVEALEQSFGDVIGRHESLRTTFAVVNQEPVQVIAPEQNFRLSVRSLDHLPADRREAEAQRLAVEDRRRPFDLARGPLMRTSLLRLGAEDHLLLVAMHHIVSDGWSMGVLIYEITSLYEAYSSGKPSPLAPLAIQYPDFAMWQREWLKGETLEEQLSYWKRQLAGAPPVIYLPTDRPRPLRHSFRGGTQILSLAKEVGDPLKRLSQQETATLFMTLLAAFQTLLARYTGQTDIVVGAPIANRNRKEIEGLIGFFVNSLVMRTDLSGNPTFREALARVRKVALGAYAHQDLPFEMIIEEVQPERTASYNPLFQVVFSMLNTPSARLELPGLTISEYDLGMETEKFDLTLGMVEYEGGLIASLGYNTDLFDATTITRMLDHFKNLLEAVAANPDRLIFAVPILSEDERRQLLDWGRPHQAAPTPFDCIHQMFEAQARLSPEAIALTAEGRQLSYAELNRRANQLARYLMREGVGP
ncbi:MAG TPA: amino acid adenylation domain-containing protein, partial [Blastocatellia bacterium]|nr:amino acid adenylation domain-containing protein [Blastocatellia bacterium]